MSFEKEDRVVYSDKHSEHDGETGTVTQVVENMFGDATYTVSFADGQESGVPEDALQLEESDVGGGDVDGPTADAGDATTDE